MSFGHWFLALPRQLMAAGSSASSGRGRTLSAARLRPTSGCWNCSDMRTHTKEKSVLRVLGSDVCVSVLQERPPPGTVFPTPSLDVRTASLA